MFVVSTKLVEDPDKKYELMYKISDLISEFIYAYDKTTGNLIFPQYLTWDNIRSFLDTYPDQNSQALKNLRDYIDKLQYDIK